MLEELGRPYVVIENDPALRWAVRVDGVDTLNVTFSTARSAGGDVETIPKQDCLVAAGDSLFAVGLAEAPKAIVAIESQCILYHSMTSTFQ